MSCTTCLTQTCEEIDDLTLYSLQGSGVFNQQTTVVVACPPGAFCQPNMYPMTFTIPAGTFFVSIPGFPDDPNFFLSPPLMLQTCQTMLSTAIPRGSTVAQITVLANTMLQTACDQQGQCNAYSISPPSFL